MARLRRYAQLLLPATIFGAAALAAMLSLRPSNWVIYAALVLAFTLTAAFHYLMARKNIATAQLIVDNQILHILPAVFQDQSKSIEVFVSCFGILIGCKIIKFNQGGIRLTDVELGRDFISLTYGTKKKKQSIKILYTHKNREELAEITRKFHYETGVIPISKNITGMLAEYQEQD